MRTLEKASTELQEALMRVREAKKNYLESLFVSVAFRKLGNKEEKTTMRTYITELQ